MRRSHGLQHFIESKAAGWAFLFAASATILRGVTFWSGGAFQVARVLGPAGLQAFQVVTGLGIAFGAELLASIFGRQWLRYLAEMREAEGRAGLRRGERAALVREYRFRAILSLVFACLGVGASFVAGFLFLLTTTGAHDPLAVAGEIVISLFLVAVMTGLGVFYDASETDDPEAEAEGHSRAARLTATQAAGERLRAGDFTAQDVRLVASAIRSPKERSRFLEAFGNVAATDPDDGPAWTVGQIAAWLGWDDDSGAGRKRITRRLQAAAKQGVAIPRSRHGAWLPPQRLVVQLFAADFLERRPASQSAPEGAKLTRLSEAVAAHFLGADSDDDATRPAPAQPADAPALAG